MRDNKNNSNRNLKTQNPRVVRGSSPKNTNYYNRASSNQRDNIRYSQRNMNNSNYKRGGTTAVRKRRKLNKKGKIFTSLFVLLLFLVVSVFVLFNTRLFQDTSMGELFEGIGTPADLKGKQVTFLVLGIADDEQERQKTRLTDLMALVTMDFENNTTKVLQIPRDTYIGQETPSGKMNAIYNRDPSYWDYSGLEGLSKMINEMFQINIDHYVTMEMDGFRDIVDAIGGVTMNVPVDMELNGTVVKAGEQTLNGEQAVTVVRTRNAYSGGDDISRTQTQHEFMKAFVKEVLSLGTAQMTKLAPSCIKYVNTDLTINEALKYYKGVSAMNSSELEVFNLPGQSGIYNSKTLGKQSVYVLDKEATATLLNENFRPHTTQVPASELKIKSLNEK